MATPKVLAASCSSAHQSVMALISAKGGIQGGPSPRDRINRTGMPTIVLAEKDVTALIGVQPLDYKHITFFWGSLPLCPPEDDGEISEEAVDW